MRLVLSHACAVLVLGLGVARAQVPPQPLAAPVPARPGSRPVTPEWLLTSLPKDHNVRLPVHWLDARRLVFVVPGVRPNSIGNIDVLDVESGRRRTIGEGENSQPSPDGQWIVFTRTVRDTARLWVMRSDGTDPRQLGQVPGLTGLAGYSYSFAWAPDGRRLALAHQPYVPTWKRMHQASSDSTKSSAVDAAQVLSPPAKGAVAVIDVASGEARTVASVDAEVRSLSWLPDGTELAFAAQRAGFRYNVEGDRVWLRAMRISDGRVRTLAGFAGLQQSLNPVVSPDGRSVAFTYDADNPLFDFMPSLGVASTTAAPEDTTPPITRVTREVKLSMPRWSRDSRRVYVLRACGAYRQLYAVDLTTGRLTQLTRDPLDITGYAVSPDGKRLAWTAQDAHARRVVRVAASGGRRPRDLAVVPVAPDDMALSEVREIDWAVPDYPARMRGLTIMPRDYQPGRRYPLIVDVHGGGAGARLYLFGGLLVSTPLEWQMWAAKGYLVFVPEFRSSAAFGHLAITRDERQEHDLVNRDIGDIVAGVDSLIARGWVDSTRIAVIGHSAGGRRANWLTVATHRFRAVVSKEGWADEWLAAGVYPEKRVTWAFGGVPVEVPEHYQKNSPIFHARGATTPTLFLMGNSDKGGADRFQTVRWLHHALRAQGVETQYVYYPDEGHVFQRPANQRDMLERVIRWVDEHLDAGVSSSPLP